MGILRQDTATPSEVSVMITELKRLMRMASEEYQSSDANALHAPQKPPEGQRVQRGEGSVVPLPKRAVESHSVAPSEALPTSEAEDDSHWPLVPPGEYQLAFVSERKVPMWGRPVWFVRMKIVDPGEHFGIVLPWPLNAIPEGKRPTPGMDFTNAFNAATERKPPKDLWRRRPRSFLDGCVFRTRVRSITRTFRGVERPPAGHYSRVECLIERISGTPPYLGGGKG